MFGYVFDSDSDDDAQAAYRSNPRDDSGTGGRRRGTQRAESRGHRISVAAGATVGAIRKTRNDERSNRTSYHISHREHAERRAPNRREESHERGDMRGHGRRGDSHERGDWRARGQRGDNREGGAQGSQDRRDRIVFKEPARPREANTGRGKVHADRRGGSRRGDLDRMGVARAGGGGHPRGNRVGAYPNQGLNMRHQKHEDGQAMGRGRGGRGGRGTQNTARGGIRAQNNTRHGPNQGNFRPLSSRLLIDILDKDPSEAATELGSLKGNLKVGLNDVHMDEERQHLFWKALAFVCGALGAEQTVMMLMTMTLDSKLYSLHLLSLLTKLRLPGETIDERRSILLKNVTIVLISAMQSLPSRASDLKVAVTLLTDAVADVASCYNREEIMDSIQSLNRDIEDIEKEKERKRQMDRISKNPPPDDFRKQDILPTAKELQAGYQPFLRPHLARGLYADADHYLDVQFRLLKEDFIYPLRNGISEYLTFKKANPDRRAKLQDVRIYEDAHYVRSVRDFSGISHHMAFKKLPRVRWHSTKRLMYGSLLILSSDDFKTYLFATVANRDINDLEQGLVAISLVDQEDAACLLNKIFVMAESSVFFEAYRPVLLGLQRMSGPCLPFAKYTLSMNHDVKCPEYLKDHIFEPGPFQYIERCEMDITPLLKQAHVDSSTIEVCDHGAWPDNDKVSLDNSQYEAVKTALTSELSIIQGPPGTGKTYIGLKIVETLLRNQDLWSTPEDPGPILLVCYTNHALDQFLEGILSFHHDGIVRVGSRSKSELLQHLNLNRLVGRRRHRDEEYVERRVRHVKKEVDTAKRRVERTQARMDGARNGIINEYELGPFMSWVHYNSLLRLYHMKPVNSWLVEWLLCERQYDKDWYQTGEQVIPEQMTGTQDETEEGKMPENDEHGKNEGTIDVEHERSAIEAERMLDDDDEDDDSDEGDDEDYPFLGLDLNELNRAEHGKLNKFIQRKMSGKDVFHPRVNPNTITDVWSMHPNDRWALYHMWLKNYLAQLKEKLPEYELKFKQLCGQLDEAKDVEKYHVLREATIIGMTTTGAANHQHVLQRVKPRIVIVEEAAEVLEAHIITALNASCQQLILIGDHQQLRPKPNVYLLARKYHLDVSLFERLINNEFPYSQLELQHRMRIELSGLMKRHFYDNLQDHESVKSYGSVEAVQKDIFFLDHAEPEDEMEDTQSHYNVHEAKFAVALCYYFLQQGYDPRQITILTAYTGQLLKIKNMMNREKFEGVKVTSIDNYQGEENDIIILSFVRSNNKGQIGFLGISNRVCVSLSRAKKGLFCIGNFTLFAEKSDLWKGIVQDLESTGSIGDSLVLQCTNHPDQTTAVKKDDDFKKVPLGGCSRDCDTRLSCGHVCRLKCHPTDLDHQIYQCKAPCSKVICERNHGCPMTCSDRCPTSCSVTVEKLLPCNHVCKTECKTNILSIKCNVVVNKILSCSHDRLLPCHMSTSGFERECEVVVDKTLRCGHTKTEKCNGTGKCYKIVPKNLECGHVCQAECHKGHRDIKCMENVEKTLACGHSHTTLCSASIDNVICNTVTRKNLSCGHVIIEKCFKKSKCPEIVEKTLLCGHKRQMVCSVETDTILCKEKCSKLLPCGHGCKKMCWEDCTNYCTETITRDDWPCGHKVEVRCSDKAESCYIPCGQTLRCGHKCQGTCGKCVQGRYHLPCTETCNKRLICGHECALKCGTPCLPCKKKCPKRCRHSQCKHPCNQPCDICMKRCNLKCEHAECQKLCCEPCDRPPCNKPCPKQRKCGHPCIGLCGEICPNKCRICDKEDLKQHRFFGTEDVETARYIQLEDCGHFFEVEGLDKFLGFGEKPKKSSGGFNKLSIKACPQCHKPIQLSRRYGNLHKESSLIKPRIIDKLEEVTIDYKEDKKLAADIETVIRLAKLEIYYLSLKPSVTAVQGMSTLRSFLGRREKPSHDRPFFDKLCDFLQTAVDTLRKEIPFPKGVLQDQRAFDLWTEMNRVNIMCDLSKFIRSKPTVTTLVPLLLKALNRNFKIEFANDLLERIYTANGQTQSRDNRKIFTRSPRPSYDMAMWLVCAKGHPVANLGQKIHTCGECRREEEDEIVQVLNEAIERDRSGHVDPRQQNERGRGRGARGRGRGRRGRGRGGRGGRGKRNR